MPAPTGSATAAGRSPPSLRRSSTGSGHSSGFRRRRPKSSRRCASTSPPSGPAHPPRPPSVPRPASRRRALRLAALCDDTLRLKGSGEVEVRGLAADSRAVEPGFLFAALPGTHTDGSRFVADALARGAVAVLGDPALAATIEVPVLIAEEPRAALARVAARF